MRPSLCRQRRGQHWRTGQPDHHRRWRLDVQRRQQQGAVPGRGRTKVETFVVKSVDGTEHTVTITITGVNDAAVITGSDTGSVVEDETNPT
ncbi:VCBS domain-containing protein [Aeromonas hydrophila]|uniref:VCBS domain-containing protein n=1 Tax=Aeromonas hydrophila TaxID=644 RepID=UPI001F0EAE26|nr:VCBS domain-containing protein [Aeromonas hydrophila]